MKILEVVIMKNKPGIEELLEVLQTEIHLLAERSDGDENIGNIKALSLLLEDRVNSLYRQAKWRKKTQEKLEIMESRTETCMCGQPWVYEEAGLCTTIGRCRDEYCFMNVKRQA